MVGRTACVLADPLAARNHWAGLIDSFLANHRRVTFWQVSGEMAKLLADRGFAVNELGFESWLDLNSFDFSGPKKRSFRTAENRFARTRHTIAEVPMAELDPERISEISLGWRCTKTNSRRELGFLIRPAKLIDEPGVRKFVIFDPDRRPVAFASFDPVFEDGRVVGYLSATRRWLPEIDPLASYYLVRHAIEKFQAEGVSRLFLGLMPLHGIEFRKGTSDWLTHNAYRLFHNTAWAQRFFYSTQSLSKHKESFGGECRQTYSAANSRLPLMSPLKLIRACGIF